MKDLLLEIGTEEIPASFLAPATETLKEQFCKFLEENRISFSKIKSYYTPRRLALLFYNVSEKQKEEILEVQGPPKKHAFDEQGRPTKVAIGFANSHKLKVKDLYTKQTPKGEYVFLKKKAEVKTIAQLLKDNLSELITNLQFPKTMRWGDSLHLPQFKFARPIRWITLVYGTKSVSVTVAGLKSSQYSQGHRNNRITKVKITNIKHYEKILKKYDVIVDAEARKQYIKKQLTVLTKKVKGKAIEDEELLQETTNICEIPHPILCEFRPEFLNLPAPVLITALKTHTRSFAVQKKHKIATLSARNDTYSELLPYFIAIANTPKCDVRQVRYWYEQAVESRLEDAKFFYNEDIKVGLENRVEQEKKVVWIENLGTLFDKTSRLEKLVVVIAQRIPHVNNGPLLKAAFLSKADLLTNMVREKEYTSLQGTMGGIYAKAAGESDLTSEIITEHYLPRSSDDKLPTTVEGAILSMADKIDNIVGAFIVNAVPSGSFDPFGLRRQAMAIGSICLNKRFFLNLEEIIELSFEYFAVEENQNLLKTIKGFFRERLNALLLDRNIRYDVANAVLTTSLIDPSRIERPDSGGINPVDSYKRACALTEFRNLAEFEPLVIGQKRVNNILRGISESFVVREELLKETAEQTLHNQAKSIEISLNEAVTRGEYKKALNLLLSLRPAIDGFFDNVLVMTEDVELKSNRLALLQYVKSLFNKVADLSEIVIG